MAETDPLYATRGSGDAGQAVAHSWRIELEGLPHARRQSGAACEGNTKLDPGTDVSLSFGQLAIFHGSWGLVAPDLR
jgi:hypothetical protein